MKQVVIQNETSRTHLKGSNVRGGPITTSDIDVRGLVKELRAHLDGEVRFDDGARALYATDGSHYRQVPIGVVLPMDVDDVIQAVAACRQYGAPIVMRGGGTSLAGQGCNVAVVIDMSKYMHNILELDPQKKRARVQPGLILDHLRHAAEQYTLTFGPDPATHNHCTLGGMIGNNSCGVHSVMAGKTVENIEELEILTYDGLRMRVGQTSDEELAQIIREGGWRGEIFARLKDLRDTYAALIRQRYPKIPRRVSGYNLDQLLHENGFHKETLIIADGFSCREQIAQTTDRQALHVAQVIQMTMSEGQEEPSRAYPEAAYTQSPMPLKATMRKAAYIVAGAGLLLAGGTWMGRFIGKKRSSKPFF